MYFDCKEQDTRTKKKKGIQEGKDVAEETREDRSGGALVEEAMLSGHSLSSSFFAPPWCSLTALRRSDDDEQLIPFPSV